MLELVIYHFRTQSLSFSFIFSKIQAQNELCERFMSTKLTFQATRKVMNHEQTPDEFKIDPHCR